MDGAALDFNSGIMSYGTGRTTVTDIFNCNVLTTIGIGVSIYRFTFVIFAISICIGKGCTITVIVVLILANTRTAAIDIATVQPLFFIDVRSTNQCRGVRCTCISCTNLTIVNCHLCVSAHMSVLTSAIDRTINAWGGTQ